MFKSFYLAGFECATGYNSRHEWIDQIAATQHDRFAMDDYAMVKSLGIDAVRESIRWPMVDGKNGYDFRCAEPFVEAAKRHDIDVIWDLFHFGYPSGLDLFSSEFPERFADYCYAGARWIRRRMAGRELSFTPINEPSFFSWAAGDAGLFAPHRHGMGYDLKVSLARAAIKGIDAIWAAAPEAGIVNVDSLCRVVAPIDADEDVLAEVLAFNEHAVFETWDMLGGKLLPELGGSPDHLGIVGMNYYWTNQWQIDQVGTPLAEGDPRAWSLSRLVEWTHNRTGRPVMISETGHVAENRPAWMLEMARECEKVLLDGLPLIGVCLYPILGMPEWHEPEVWTRMGLWDLIASDGNADLRRIPHAPTHDAFHIARRLDRLHRDRRPHAPDLHAASSRSPLAHVP